MPLSERSGEQTDRPSKLGVMSYEDDPRAFAMPGDIGGSAYELSCLLRVPKEGSVNGTDSRGTDPPLLGKKSWSTR